MIVRKDKFGIYGIVGGYKCRPVSATSFKEGMKVKAYHFGGSTLVGVGKNGVSKKGKYLEHWITNHEDNN